MYVRDKLKNHWIDFLSEADASPQTYEAESCYYLGVRKPRTALDIFAI